MNEMTKDMFPKNIWELLEKLKKNNYPKELYKSEIDRYFEFKSRDFGVPFSGHFELTPLCNLDCKMCYVHLNKAQMNGAELLTVEQWKSLMLQAKNAGMRQASLSGGECLTYPGFDELYLYLQSLGVDIIVYTNAMLLDEKRIDFFCKHPPIRIQISLYGSNDDVYEKVTGSRSFGIVSHNLENALKAKLPVNVAVTPSKFIDEDIENIFLYLHSLNVTYTINSGLFKPRDNTGRHNEDNDLTIERYADIYRYNYKLHDIELKYVDEAELPPIGGGLTAVNETGIRCGAGRSNFAVSWDGIMHPCGQFQQIKESPLVNGFDACWKSLNKWAAEYPRIPACEGCAYVEVCSYCAAQFENFVGPGERCDFWCQRAKLMVKHGINHIDSCG